MVGREGELCPFDADEVQFSMNELDREFTEMFR